MSSPPRMQDLFAAARDDAPSDLVRDQVWGRVAAATAAPASAAATAKAAAAPAGAKLLVTGVAIGAATAALAALAIDSLAAGPSAPPAGALRAPAVVVSGPAAGARLAEPAPRGRAAPATEPAAAGAHVEASAPSVGQHAEASASVATLGEASALAEEARLVTEARLALVRGEPERALSLARSTRRLPARALEPEELALEARALRALGRADEALATELTLRRRFPSHALSR